MAKQGCPPCCAPTQVTSLVAAGTSSIPKLSTLLQQLIGHLNRELGTLQVSQTGGDVAVDGSRPHIKGCVVHLEVLGHILDMVPRQVTMQYVTEAQVGAVGAIWRPGGGGGARAGVRSDRVVRE